METEDRAWLLTEVLLFIIKIEKYCKNSIIE